ncbi:hypothetical protein [Maribacter sp. MAR_2009_72]|uniref:hypothetical protein n=1 Tax=Maribacter sp. MAR_2009_72 TaxID=1250050 RepID=UPI0011997F18|nr:hypothetical protein [Maribacter sp. MAR_2009_72]TVZ16645.1 hypothetical protein JM81_2911 [Maribacter sp. MAR_2009_72]
MIKYVITALFSASMLTAQTNNDNVQNSVKVGDVYEIGTPKVHKYQHIDFPRANFIIKKGGIANYKTVEGNTVVVTEVKETKDGNTQIKMKRTDGTRFFRTHPTVTANYSEALASGELVSK